MEPGVMVRPPDLMSVMMSPLLSAMPSATVMLTGVGLIFGLLALVFGIYVVFDKIINHTPAGWASVMLVILLTTSFQMVMMGVLGEYLWRNLDESRKRPLYVIDQIILPEAEKNHQSLPGTKQPHKT